MEPVEPKLDANSNNVCQLLQGRHNWVVPNTASNNYKIRITGIQQHSHRSEWLYIYRAGPACSFNTTQRSCEGYVQLNWAAIASATSYDVFPIERR